MSNTVTPEIKNCVDCPHHAVRPDPDPDDWFNDDDVLVICTRAPVNKGGQYKRVTSACRPYNIRKECEIPNWCPLKTEEKPNAA